MQSGAANVKKFGDLADIITAESQRLVDTFFLRLIPCFFEGGEFLPFPCPRGILPVPGQPR